MPQKAQTSLTIGDVSTTNASHVEWINHIRSTVCLRVPTATLPSNTGTGGIIHTGDVRPTIGTDRRYSNLISGFPRWRHWYRMMSEESFASCTKLRVLRILCGARTLVKTRTGSKCAYLTECNNGSRQSHGSCNLQEKIAELVHELDVACSTRPGPMWVTVYRMGCGVN